MDNPFKKISVIGLGYIGLPTAAMLASRKIEVVGVDTNEAVVNKINCGEIHIVEPDLDMVVSAAVNKGYLRATTAAEPAEAFIISVPTPFKGENHEPDLSYVEAAANMIGPVLEKGNLVILESTSPVGTTETLASWLADLRPDLSFPQNAGEHSDIRVAYCPERVLPGKVMRELIANDRVLGGMTARCSAHAARLYHIFVSGNCTVASSPRIAEMTKLTENSFRDVNIAFANELSMICDRLGLNVWELISLTNRHPRVDILQPGPGVGGHCIAVDPWFIISAVPEQAQLIKKSREVNDKKPKWVLEKVQVAIAADLAAHAKKSASDVTLAIYGISFKQDIDDLRNSPALDIAAEIALVHTGTVLVIEPHIRALPPVLNLPNVRLIDSTVKADVHILLVDHASFKEMEKPKGVIVDTRGIWSRSL
jgi:UDP-N-acetyl-D-mannosaminuronic acid dehydrogenase